MYDDDVEIIEPAEWTFLYEEPDNGWWLKIDNCNDLIWYHLHTQERWSVVLEDYMSHADKYEETGSPYCFKHNLTVAVVRYGEQKRLTILDAITQFKMMVAAQQMEAIHQNGYIVLNKVGGYHAGPIESSQFVRRKTFTWPDFKESDIRITRYPGGTHWYVHIGDMELHEDENIKWMSESDARMAAKRYINKEDSDG